MAEKLQYQIGKEKPHNANVPRVPVSRPDEIPRSIGVMPNFAYNKTQFNDLDIYKKIEPVLKTDPVAMLGWQSYATGNLEIREVKKDLSDRGGAFQSARNQQANVKYGFRRTGRESENEELAAHRSFGSKVPREFRSSQDVDKMYHVSQSPEYRAANPQKSDAYETKRLIHELRHAGLEFLTRRTGVERRILDYSVEAFNKYDPEGTFRDEEGVFTALDRADHSEYFPDINFTVGANRRKATDIYDKHKDARKEIDARVKMLNTLATKELNAIKNTSVSKRLKQKSMDKGDKSILQKFLDMFVNRPADAIGRGIDALPFNEGGQVKSLDTQMKALKVG